MNGKGIDKHSFQKDVGLIGKVGNGVQKEKKKSMP